MQLYKFLRMKRLIPCRISPYQINQYPSPGVWTPEIKGEPIKNENGYHLARPSNLAYGIYAELWRVEVAHPDSIVDDEDTIVTTSPVRLVERVYKWRPETMAQLAGDCAERAKIASTVGKVIATRMALHAVDMSTADKTAINNCTGAANIAASNAAACAGLAKRAKTDDYTEAATAAAAATNVAAAAAAAAVEYARVAETSDADPDVEQHAKVNARAAERHWQSRKICELLDLEWED